MEPVSYIAIPAERTLDTVTAEEWRRATFAERQEFIGQQCALGYVSFVCLACGFPVTYGGAPCAACEHANGA